MCNRKQVDSSSNSIQKNGSGSQDHDKQEVLLPIHELDSENEHSCGLIDNKIKAQLNQVSKDGEDKPFNLQQVGFKLANKNLTKEESPSDYKARKRSLRIGKKRTINEFR